MAFGPRASAWCGVIATVSAAGACLALAGTAAADTLHVAPGAPDTGACTVGDPCELEHAVETVSVSGDEILAAAGTYSGAEVGDPTSGADGGLLLVAKAVTLRGAGATGAASTTIMSTDVLGLGAGGSPGIVVSDLSIENSFGFGLDLSSGRAERVHVRTTAGGATACRLRNQTVTVRDSVCFTEAAADAIGVIGTTARLVNVTAFTDPSLSRNAIAAFEDSTVTASNVIAQSLNGSDVHADLDATVTLDHSNYDTTGGLGTVTVPGTNDNQTGSPQFLDASNGDFHQASTSPTIDAGDSSAADIGMSDVAGDARVQGTATDIGAFEFTVESAGPCQAPASGGGDYQAAILADSPGGYWRLGETSGTTAADSSANANDGTYLGPFALGAPGALAGDPDTAVDLSAGGHARVETPYRPFVNGSTRSYEGWACREEPDSFDPFFSGSRKGASPGLYTSEAKPKRVYFDARLQGGTAAVSWPAAVPDVGEWFHWTLVFDETANTAELFINGSSEGTRVVTEPYHKHAGEFRIGNYPDNKGWNGVLDEVAVYEQALPAPTICAHHAAGGGACASP